MSSWPQVAANRFQDHPTLDLNDLYVHLDLLPQYSIDDHDQLPALLGRIQALSGPGPGVPAAASSLAKLS